MPDTPVPAAAGPPRKLALDEPGALIDPSAKRPQSAADAPAAGTPPAPRAGPASSTSGAPGPLRAPVRGPVVVAWLVEASRVCGDWLSLSAVTAAHQVGLTVANEATFRKWCTHLNIPGRRITLHTDELGRFLQAATTAHGWTITVHLHNPTTQEARR